MKPLTKAEQLAQNTRELLATLTPKDERATPGEQSTFTPETFTPDQAMRERIRHIEAKALRKLRHPSRDRDLKTFLKTETKDKQ